MARLAGGAGGQDCRIFHKNAADKADDATLGAPYDENR